MRIIQKNGSTPIHKASKFFRQSLERMALLALILWCFVYDSLGSTKVDPPQESLKILADQMDCDQSTNKCVATGNAVAQKLNDPKNSTLSADILTAFFAKKDPDQPAKLVRIEAEGNVVVTTGDIIVRAPRAYYTVEEEYAELFEDVHVTNNLNHIHGSHGEVFFKTGQYKIVCETEGQVQALLFSKESKPTNAP